MNSRALMAAAVLTSALMSGGWLMERGGGPSALRDATSQAQLFDEVLRHLRRDYVDTLSDSTLYRRAVAGVLEELHDPHSVFLDSKRLSRLDESTSGKYAGVGIQMDVRDSGITVTGTLPGTPAERAGIVGGDRIVAIEGKSTHGLTAEESVKELRGPAGSTVRIEVERTSSVERLRFSLMRTVIQVNPVQHAMMLPDHATGYVGLTVFSASAAEDLAHAVDSLRSAGARALVLDLRGNPGGLLDQGVGVADLFLDKGQSIVATHGRTPGDNQSYRDGVGQRYTGMPLVVLTDSGSASASEIVAGALQDHDRALIIGTATYGKGSAQHVFRLGGGAVKLTTALWYTPSGRSIDRPHVRSAAEGAHYSDGPRPRQTFHTDAGRAVSGGGGIIPDVIVAARSSPNEDRSLQVALGSRLPQFRDAVLEYALALKASHSISRPDFPVTQAMRDELFRRLTSRGIIVPRAEYDSASSFVTRALAAQLTRNLFGANAEFERKIKQDETIAKAEELLKGATSQKALLARAEAATH